MAGHPDSRSSFFAHLLQLVIVLVNLFNTKLTLINSSSRFDEACCRLLLNCGYSSGLLDALPYTSSTCTPFSTAIFQPAPVCHGSVHISGSLHRINYTLLWARPLYSSPYRPRVSRAYNVVVCAALLLSAGDIELNPGPQSLQFGYININSAIKKSALLHDLISNHSIDILALSETRFTHTTPNAIKDDISPAGFSVHHVHRTPTANHPSGGGLALIHRSDIIIKPHPLAVSIKPSTFELQLIRITSVKPSITVINAYRPPSLSVTQFHDELADVLSAVSVSTTDRLLLCGDLNCPGVDAVSVADELADVIDVHGLHQHVTQPTRPTPDYLLDVFATDTALPVRDVHVDDAGLISDHRLVLAAVVVDSVKHNPPVVFTYRRIRTMDTRVFERKLHDSSLFSSPAQTAEGYANQLKCVVTATLDELAPVRQCVRRPPKAVSKFLSTEAVDAKRLRRRLERRWKETQSEADRIVYRGACRRANKLINASRQDYCRDQLLAASTAKDRWRVSKELLHSIDTVHHHTPDELDRLCCLFSNFFVDKICNLKRSVAANISGLASYAFSDPVSSGTKLDSLPTVTIQEVNKLITSLQPKTSSVDYIPTSLIKQCPTTFSQLICTLANLSFSEGAFPAMFKTASVTPLIKKAGLDADTPSNYRPISNLNNISKMLERLFLARIQPHVLSSPNFNSLQSAYRPYHSTETALLLSLNNIYHASDNSQPSLLVSLDLSAAFDTIDHSLLLSRLETSFGITGTALSWLSSYLSNRSQVVRIGQSSSPPTCLDSGVPQGSVLGPILFSIFVAPIGKIVSDHGILHQQYADDTQLYIALSTSDPYSDISKLESSLSSLNSWFCQNGLCLNPSKSEAILFGTHQRLLHFPSLPSINIANSTVKLSDKLTTLGVTLDSTLSFNSHVSNICKSCHFHLRALKHIRPVLTDEMALSIAVALVQSRLDYANSILYRTSQQNINKLQRIQNYAARLVLCNNNISGSDSLLQLHWLPMPKRIDFKIATVTYKLLNCQQPSYLRSLINYDVPIRQLRSSALQKLHQPTVRKAIGDRAFSSASPSVWNNIPLPIRSTQSFDSFKRLLKTFYFGSQ